MAAILLFQNERYTPEAFARLETGDFPGLAAGQQFIRDWLKNKPFFNQKTSGSTGKPTLHKISRYQLEASVRRTIKALHLQPKLKALVCINMEYIGGKMMLTRGLMNDWLLQLVPPCADPSSGIETESFDFAAMVPLQLQKLIGTDQGRAFLNGIGTVIIGGAAVDKALVKTLQGLKCRLYATYGMTETVSHVALQRLNGQNRAEHFHLLPGIRHRVDERGCLMLRADVTAHQWIATNDSVSFHGPDTFTLLGRADHVINTGGVKVQIEALEAQIRATGLLKGQPMAISSLPDTSLGHSIVLVMETLPENPDKLLKKLKAKLPHYHAPKALYALGKLPETDSGKLDRPAITEHLKRNFSFE